MRIFAALLLSALLAGTAAGLAIGGPTVFATLPIALASAFLFGLPAYLALRRLGWLRPWQLALAGIVVVSPWVYLAGREWLLGVVIAVSGALAGMVFWWVGISENSRGPGAEA